MNKVKTEIRYSYSSRIAEFTPPFRTREIITVSQRADSDNILKEPQTSWTSIGSVGVESADDFANAMRTAVRLARRWNRDTGKKVTEIPGIMRYRKPNKKSNRRTGEGV